MINPAVTPEKLCAEYGICSPLIRKLGNWSAFPSFYGFFYSPYKRVPSTIRNVMNQ